jgi:hypothetical protein
MRYSFEDEPFAQDFVEFSDSWSRAQVRAAWAAVDQSEGSETKLLDALRPKVIALHLTCVDAPAITDPSDLTPARTEQLDWRLFSWFAGVWIKHLGELATLGNVYGRKLFATLDIVATMEPALANQNHS